MKINRFKHLGSYRLLVTFADGTQREADFGPFVEQSTNPLIRQFADPDRFITVHLGEFGVLVWGDDEMDINPVRIYEKPTLPSTKSNYGMYETLTAKEIERLEQYPAAREVDLDASIEQRVNSSDTPDTSRKLAPIRLG